MVVAHELREKEAVLAARVDGGGRGLWWQRKRRRRKKYEVLAIGES